MGELIGKVRELLGLGAKDHFPGINAALPAISRRAERLDPKQQADTFVSLRNVENSLMNRDHRVLFGRRGTGKTHILSYVAAKVEASGNVAILMDLRKLGSNGYIYSDEALSVEERATRLLRDFIEGLETAFIDLVTRPDSSFDLEKIYPRLETLASSVKEVLVAEKYEQNAEVAKSEKSDSTAKIGGRIGLTGVAVSGSGEMLDGSTEDEKSSVKKTGTVRLSISIGSANRAIADIISALNCRVWILLDEWSALPESLQPYLADFIKRVLFPIDSASVSIAAIEQRSSFRKEGGSIPFGIELGSDAFADINLDDYLVFENNPGASAEFFRELIFRHLKALYPDTLPFADAIEFQNQAFTQENAFLELVRASEGVPRDFINIIQLAATKSGEDRISISAVRAAAKDWYDRDKAAYIDSNKEGRDLLHWIVDTIIGVRKARAFLVRSDVRDPTLDRLFDERILNIAKRSYSAKDEPGVRYRVWKIDFGCYVDSINTVRAPTGFLYDKQDEEVNGYIPEDDLRAVRRSILDLEDYYRQS